MPDPDPRSRAAGSTRHPSPRSRARGPAQQSERLWWSALPVLTVGLLAPVPFLRLALITRRRAPLVVCAGYLAAVATAWLLVTQGGADSDATVVGAALALLVTVTAAVHSWLAYRVTPAELVRDTRRGPPPRDLPVPERRARARLVAVRDPELARDLGIGRSDPGTYPDGGLVDPDVADLRALVERAGLTESEAASVLEARGRLGGRFSGPNELAVYADLAPGRFEEVADNFIFIR